MSEIKKVFQSRYKDGLIVEADWSQLEVYALAFLSGDKQLQKDLMSGVDIHSMNAATLAGMSYHAFMVKVVADDADAIKKRKLAKALSFQLQYGAGPAKMAKTNKCSEKLAKEFIKNYFARYPQVKKYHEYLLESARILRKSSAARTPKGLPAGMYKMTSVTGRIYTFYEQDDWNNGTSFSPTQLKNYPIQGFATGDIVPMVLGAVQDEIFSRGLQEEVLLINTIHDSIILDIKEHRLKEVADLLTYCMEYMVPVLLKSYFNIDFDLPLHATIKYGPNWMEMTDYEL